MNWYVIAIYLVMAVFWAFVPQMLLGQNWSLAILQALCASGLVGWNWRRLSKRGVKLDNRIGWCFLTYLGATLATNIVLAWVGLGAF